MEITISIPASILSTEEKERLFQTLGLQNDSELEGVILAAFCEYKDMLLGNGLSTRADEIKQHRLYHLIKNFFVGHIPTEMEVARMFQLTESESKSLIKNVRTRFRYKLQAELNTSLKAALEEFAITNDKYEAVVSSDNILEELNVIVAQKDATLEPIKKVRDSSKKYSMPEDTYNALQEYFA